MGNLSRVLIHGVPFFLNLKKGVYFLHSSLWCGESKFSTITSFGTGSRILYSMFHKTLGCGSIFFCMLLTGTIFNFFSVWNHRDFLTFCLEVTEIKVEFLFESHRNFACIVIQHPCMMPWRLSQNFHLYGVNFLFLFVKKKSHSLKSRNLSLACPVRLYRTLF